MAKQLALAPTKDNPDPFADARRAHPPGHVLIRFVHRAIGYEYIAAFPPSSPYWGMCQSEQTVEVQMVTSPQQSK